MDEIALSKEIVTIETRADSIAVIDKESFRGAAEFLRAIKTAAGKVGEFFEPMKKSAYDSWKAICNKENEFKKPLDAAEKTVKGKVSAYQMEQDRIRRAQEEELRRKRQEEADRMAAEAEKLAEEGKTAEAEKVFNQAVKVETARVFVPETPKASGMSFKTDYVVRITDERAVPAYIGGICLRPIDTAALKRLAVTFKGKVEIPGIVIEETKIAAVSRY